MAGHSAAGTDATSGEAGRTGRAGAAPSSNGGSDAPPAPRELEVRITAQFSEGPKAPCAGDCLFLSAQVTGGQAPYSFTWSDGALSGAGPHWVCPEDGNVSYAVDVTDTPREDDEFTRPQAEGSATVDIAIEPCTEKPKGCEPKTTEPYAFEPTQKWSWSGGFILASPLVANLTDDNGDGKKDLQDVPDVVVVPYYEEPDVAGDEAALVVIDGATGREHLRSHNARHDNAPALGDLDGDGVPEIVMVQAYWHRIEDPSNGPRLLAAVDGQGRPKWRSEFATVQNQVYGPTAISIADLDRDGKPEVIAWPEVFNSEGGLLFYVGGETRDEPTYTSPVTADLDGDGMLEIVVGGNAYRYDGSVYFSNAEVNAVTHEDAGSAFNAIADLDGDGAPEIVVTTHRSTYVLDRGGETLRSIPNMHTSAFPFPPAIAAPRAGERPAIFVSDGQLLAAYTGELDTLWVALASDDGSAAPTVFDFEGDGRAEVIYGDERHLRVLAADSGEMILDLPRSSVTFIDYPVIADIDNDGSADLLAITSGSPGETALPALTVLSDFEKRWMPARRVFNQDAYSVTNVNEDGTIPSAPAASWQLNNSFRSQAYVDREGNVCIPALH